MKRAWKWTLIVVACITAGALGLIWTASELSKCRYIETSPTYSPDKKFYTQMQATHCEDDAKSRDQLVMGEAGKQGASVLLEFNASFDTLDQSWLDGPDGPVLHVRVLESAIRKRYGPYENLPSVVVTSPGMPSGYFNFDYVESSGSMLVFRLENHSTESVYIRASIDENGASPIGGQTNLTCRKLRSPAYVDENGPIGEAVFETVHVPPGATQKVVVNGSFARQYKGGSCRLRLTLQGGTFVESSYFAP
jgi:hypothetical protein